MYSPSRRVTMVLESSFLDKAQCCTYVGIKFIAVIPSSLSDTITVRVCLFVFCFCLFVCLFFSFAKCVTILVSFSSGKNDFPYFWAVTGALSLHNFQEVGIISFPAHIFVRRLVPPPQVLLQSCQSPTCHLYSEGHGFTLHFCHAAGGGSKWQKNPRLQQPFHSLALSRIRKR